MNVSLILTLVTAIGYVFEALIIMIIVRAFMSFLPQIDRNHPAVRVLDSVVDPILTPFQRMLPPMAGLDFSPILAILTLQICQFLVTRLLMGFFPVM